MAQTTGCDPVLEKGKTQSIDEFYNTPKTQSAMKITWWAFGI